MFLIPLWPGGTVAQLSGLSSGPGGLQPLPTDPLPSGPSCLWGCLEEQSHSRRSQGQRSSPTLNSTCEGQHPVCHPLPGNPCAPQSCRHHLVPKTLSLPQTLRKTSASHQERPHRSHWTRGRGLHWLPPAHSPLRRGFPGSRDHTSHVHRCTCACVRSCVGARPEVPPGLFTEPGLLC